MKKDSRFLAVDLAVESRSNLQPLAAEFGERVCLNHCGARNKMLAAATNKELAKLRSR